MLQQIQIKTDKPVIVNEKYVLIRVLQNTEYSTVFEGVQIQSSKVCIIKMITIQHKTNEGTILTALQGKKCMPKVIEMGEFMDRFAYIVLERVGPSIKVWYNILKHNFSYECLALIGYKMLTGIASFHEAGYVHTNIRLSNILTKDNKLIFSHMHYAVKFTSNFKDFKANLKYIGAHVNKYSSLGRHHNLMPTPKDDLETLCYLLINILSRGELFIDSKKHKNKHNKYKYYMDVKQNLMAEKILKRYPDCFIQFYNLVKCLNSKDININYEQLWRPFKEYLGNNQKLQFDWVQLIQQAKQQHSQGQSTHSFEDDEPRKGMQQQLDTIIEKSSEMVISTVLGKTMQMAQYNCGDSDGVSSDDSGELEEDDSQHSTISQLPQFQTKQL